MKKLVIILFSIVSALYSCTEPSLRPVYDSAESFLTGSGVFIVNEGNFRWGNGSISYYSLDSVKITNDIFYAINKRPLGDVPNSMVISGENAYLVVNNSGTIEVVDRKTFKTITTIPGLKSPRNIGLVDDLKAYVTSMYSDSLAILDLKNNVVNGFIDIGRSSESVIVTGNRAFVASWIGENKITVINTLTNGIITTIGVGMEPESMVLDKNNMLWVLCNGGWERKYNAELIMINVLTLAIEKRFVFPQITDSPSCLQVNGRGDSLFFLQDGIRSMNIGSDYLPGGIVVPQTSHFFYKLGINPLNGEIFATDAADYQKNGELVIYSRKGVYLRALKAGIIPGSMYFKVQTGQATQ